MASKYKIRKEDMPLFFRMVDQYMETMGYHEVYKKLGWQRGSNGNFHCWNATAHGRGSDNNPSLSVNDKTGQWNCFSCNCAGNFQSYWREVLKGGQYGDSYSDFVIDLLGLNATDIMGFSQDFDEKEFEANREKMAKFAEALNKRFEEHKGTKYLMTSELQELMKEEASIPKETVDQLVAALKANPGKVNYLKETRHVTEAIIDRLRIGLNQYGAYTIPIFDPEGNCLNIKKYDPFTEKTEYKWLYWEKGLPVRPLPIDNFTKPKIYIFEGEPDMLCALGFGIDGAVTMGSKSNKDVNVVFGPDMARQIFYNKEVVIVFDSDNEPDKTGRTSQQTLAHSLYPYAKQIKIINLDRDEKINPNGLDPSLTKTVKTKGGKEKPKRTEKDFTDYMRKNGFDEKAARCFHELVERTLAYTEDEKRERVNLDETALAQQLLKDSTRIIYCVKGFYNYEGNVYIYLPETVMSASITRYLQHHRDLFKGPVTHRKTGTVLLNIKGFCLVTPDPEPGTFLSRVTDNPDFLALDNGILDIKKYLQGDVQNALICHTDDFFNLACIPYRFTIGADCPNWKAFLDTVLPDEASQRILQELFGYCLTSDSRYQKFFILYGEGANGKSVVLVVLTALLGQENVSHVALEQFEKNAQLYLTYGKLANIAPEMGTVDKAAEGLLKAYAAGEAIVFEAKFKDAFSANPTAKLIFATNTLPNFRDKSHGIWRRISLLPFNITIPEEQQDKMLAQKIIEKELPGILNWALEGLRRLRQQDHFTESDVSEAAKREYMKETNSVLSFLEDECALDADYEVPSRSLYEAYKEYCEKGGWQTMSDSRFGKELKRAWPSVIKKPKGTGRGKSYIGIMCLGRDSVRNVRIAADSEG